MTRGPGNKDTTRKRASALKPITGRVPSDFGSLLSAEDSAVLIVDPFPLPGHQLIDPTQAVPEAMGPICRCAQYIDVPVVISVFSLADENPLEYYDELAPITENALHVRDMLNAWDHGSFVEAIEKTNRKRLVLLGGWSHETVAMTALTALADGYHVHLVIDTCSDPVTGSVELSLHRFMQAGVVPISWRQVVFEWLRDQPELFHKSEIHDFIAEDPQLAPWVQMLAMPTV